MQKPDVSVEGFQWPDAFRERVEAFRRSNAALRAGRDLVDGGIYRFRAFEPVVIDLFADWTANPLGNRSWQWHSASFNFMSWLIAVHAVTGDQRALDHAARAIETWHRQFVVADSDYEFAWHDHATSNRIMAVLSLLCHLDEHPGKFDLNVLIPEFLAAHGDRLCLEEMYSKHTNHGIDQSRALLLLATCAPWLEGASRWSQVALARLEDELGHAFAADGGHVENSPGYHQFVSKLFADVLQTFGDTLDAPFRDRLRGKLVEAARFMAWIVRPDGRLPLIGDTECKPAVNVYQPLEGTGEYSHVQWVCSRGRSGTRPEGWSRLFPDAGYFVARNDWESAEAPGEALHLVFRCGQLSEYHRHDDDLSLTLWWGNDWLLDGGGYSYVERHPVRRYLRSKWGHNVVVVDDGNYAWTRPGAAAPGSLVQVDDEATRPVVKGETESYPGLHAVREVAVEDKGMRFEVTDRLSARDGEGSVRKFVSLWHVPADKTISIEGQSVRLSDAEFMREIVIRNLGEPFDRIDILEAFPNGDTPVWSRELNRFERCKLIVFERLCEHFESRLEFHLKDVRPEHHDVGTVNARPRGLLRSYGLAPAGWWPQQGEHHGRKISSRLTQIGKDGVSGDAFVEGLLAMAVVRQGRHGPTLHLSSSGNPDAALVEPRLRAAMGMLWAGEVYLPASVQRVIRGWPAEDRFLFIDAVHLLHAGAKPGAEMFNTVINSSQGQYQDVFWRGDKNAVRVLVLREPVDAALNAMAQARPSAGWRHAADAEAALARQVQRLKRFSVWAVRQKFALEFRIEDFSQAPGPVLDRIGSLCGAMPDMHALTALPPIEPLSAAQTDSELGSIHGIPVREMLAERLSDVRKRLGYA
ncbi:heparinase II/III domain-containing protein [Luteimonas terricola]|uniref:Heparin-sulfate lyase N-terminal domain-containing protein n=1 Tax=Luteimonas terricola TaxID=645597 RepID=A0ABQ2EIC0_9GAMM|nr:heparinase II/III family protein [Luteimonas terricola]GGK13391.1 hypothetical protein GCM10011394_23300 [Luteimonas terricola]